MQDSVKGDDDCQIKVLVFVYWLYRLLHPHTEALAVPWLLLVQEPAIITISTAVMIFHSKCIGCK
jgi:hypothetical protein